jgi:phage tail sheath protein FI
MPYLHGAFGEQVPTQDKLPPLGVGTIPIYIGTAPLTEVVDTAAAINKPVIAYTFEDCKTKLGYSDDWDKNTLCEAMYAHFKNSIRPIGPVIFINVYNPAIHTELSPVASVDIIGGTSVDGVRTGIDCVELVYQMFGVIPSILAAPGWRQNPTVYEALVAIANKINGHWDAVCVVDIDSTAADTLAEAKTWKTTNTYTDKEAKVCWPKVIKEDKEFWLSTLTVVRMQQTDYENDNTPYESPSNKPLDITGTVVANGTAIMFDEAQANDLNSEGITTVTYRAGRWVLWGPHNGNYKYGTEIDPKDKFDCSIRMMRYLTNMFQVNYMADIDSPLNRAKVDTILNDAQAWLNSLVSDGKVLLAEIAFNETSNPVASIVEGDFVFDVQTTTTPPGKSLTFKVQYTTAGISTLYGGES